MEGLYQRGLPCLVLLYSVFYIFCKFYMYKFLAILYVQFYMYKFLAILFVLNIALLCKFLVCTASSICTQAYIYSSSFLSRTEPQSPEHTNNLIHPCLLQFYWAGADYRYMLYIITTVSDLCSSLFFFFTLVLLP